jgi:hypothetical protein
MLGLLKVKLEKTARQRRAVKAITDIGGVVLYDFQLKRNGVDEGGEFRSVVDMNAEPTVPRWVCGITGVDFFAKVRVVRFSFSELCSDEDLAALRDLPDLEELDISGFLRITDRGLHNIVGLADLQDLTICDSISCPIANPEQAALKTTMPYFSCALTEMAFADFRSLRRLQRFRLGIFELSDAQVESLATLKGLRRLDLAGTKVSDAGIEKLQRALPGCKVKRGFTGDMPEPY